MKKIVLLISFCVIAASGFSKTDPFTYYLNSKNENVYCKKIQMENETIKVVLENGMKAEVAASEVRMYCRKGKIFEKLPVYVDNKPTNSCAFMEFVSTRSGLRLYKYSTREFKKYYVFKGDQFWSEINEKNYATMMSFFKEI